LNLHGISEREPHEQAMAKVKAKRGKEPTEDALLGFATVSPSPSLTVANGVQGKGSA
jgi:hypothetical protein